LGFLAALLLSRRLLNLNAAEKVKTDTANSKGAHSKDCRRRLLLLVLEAVLQRLPGVKKIVSVYS
jgi:hypothetical protein